MRVVSIEMLSVKVGTQLLSSEQSTSWADFNLGASTISMESGGVQVVIPLDSVEQAIVSWQRGFLKAVFKLSTSLHLEEEWVSKVRVAFPFDSAVVTILQQMLGNRLKVEQRARGSRSDPVKVVGEVVEGNSNNLQQPITLAVSK